MELMTLTIDLRVLVYTGVLSLLIPVIYLIGRMKTKDGLKWGMSNRDQPLEIPAWARRAERAHANLTENLAPFAILVLVAHVAGEANELTALGARIFFWARVAHVAIYTAGITGLRSLAFFAGMAGEIIILSQILA